MAGDETGLGLLIAVCRVQPFEVDDCICIGDSANATANRWAFGDDKTAFEAFVNHIHLDRLLQHLSAAGQADRTALFRLIVACVGTAALPLLRGRQLLFFVGGETIEDCTVRFHVERDSGPWVDVQDELFLSKEGLSVWRFSAMGMELMFEPSGDRGGPLR